MIGARLKRKRGIPYVLWCMDLYPEALAAHGLLRPSHPAYRLLARVGRKERSQAARVIALGPDMRDRLHQDGTREIVDIPVWSGLTVDAVIMQKAIEMRRALGWRSDEIIVMYSGNMGRAHRADEFAELSLVLRVGSPRCRLIMSGDGPQKAEWQKRWGDRFEFIPAVAADLVAAHLLAADIHLVSQQLEWNGVVVPSKFQAACALGRPVLFAGPPGSSVGQWLREADAGWIITPGDRAALPEIAAELRDPGQRQAKGRRARQLFEEKFSPARNGGRLCAIIEDAVAEREDP
jgi:glycosyltransferase involved in cell wall biosynthesis